MQLYGVFEKFANGSRLWIGPADDLNEAKALMTASAAKTGLEHFVRDFVLEQIVATSREGSGATDLYGVFMRFGTGSRLCIAHANDLTVAKAKMEEGARESGVEHFVYDFGLEQVVATSAEKSTDAGSAIPRARRQRQSG